MDAAARRFALALGLATAAHGALLATLAAGTAGSGDTPLRVTRSVAPASAEVEERVRATRDQRGDDDRSQRGRRAAPGTAQRPTPAGDPAAARVTRYVLIADSPSPAPAAETTQAASAEPTPRPQRTRTARGDARAAYLSRWQSRIETLGSHALPDALLGGRDRRLTLAVRVAADGSLNDARVIRSSGRPALDAAALRLVRTAAPYPPFDADRIGGRELNFAYDWLFEAGGAARLRARR
ncbi:energy transducer TonB [Salinisphaera orenii]|uniref:TonB C-terminal domain-containing protein n=1 Tax=Salinisphaera orenii YIM 95161 TaxID=1051139 RepID=A0A423PI26_9GAMM|nr:TonB family protein [Salinisphaera halophila]ROO25261.1 hypothetical protein SAHL_14585 [Salinisphaera halophila YIM 95161]